MSGFRQYILTIIISAFACSLCAMITEKSSVNRVMKLLTGLIMTVTVLSPIKRISFLNLQEVYDDFEMSSDIWISDGLRMAEAAKSKIIMQEVESYILDRAEQLGSCLSVELKLDEKLMPETVVMRGSVSPYVKKQISEMLVKDLGITKENQVWSG